MNHNPPYDVTAEGINCLARICEIVGRDAPLIGSESQQLRLRRTNAIRTVQATCAIEGNPLGIDQVSALVEGKVVVGAPDEILEIQNALNVYDAIDRWKMNSEKDMLKAHAMLMAGLLDQPGRYRSGSAGIQKGDTIVHLAPPAEHVPGLMKDLFKWLGTTREHPLISSTVFHYEFEFIHPFIDGNGRLGRLWQSKILRTWNPLFNYVPVETLIRENQQAYYEALNQSNACGKATPFMQFMLDIIEKALLRLHVTDQPGGANALDEQILNLLRSSYVPLRVTHLVNQLNVSRRTVERAIKRLRDAKRLEFQGPPKTGGYVVIDN